MHPLRKHRRRQALTQLDLARRAGISLRTIVNIENRKNKPQMNTQRLILRALGFTNFPKDRRTLFDAAMH